MLGAAGACLGLTTATATAIAAASAAVAVIMAVVVVMDVAASVTLSFSTKRPGLRACVPFATSGLPCTSRHPQALTGRSIARLIPLGRRPTPWPPVLCPNPRGLSAQIEGIYPKNLPAVPNTQSLHTLHLRTLDS